MTARAAPRTASWTALRAMLAGAVLAGAVLWAAHACGDRRGGAVRALGDLPGPGAEVTGGLTVPDGAVLVGRAFPESDHTSHALLLVTGGDPVAALRDLLARARTAGYDMQPGGSASAGAPGICRIAVVTAPDGVIVDLPVDRPLPPGGALERLACEARSVPRAVRISLYLPQLYTRGDLPVIEVWHEPDPAPADPTPADPTPTDRAPTDRATAVPDPAVPLRVGRPPDRLAAGVGDRLGQGMVPKWESYTVVAGSRPAGPVLDAYLSSHFDECTAGGMVAWLEVTGDPRPVHDAYVGQGVRNRQGHRTETSYRSGDAAVRRTAFRGGLVVETVTTAGRPAYLRLDRCQE